MPTYDQILDQIEDLRKEVVAMEMDILRLAMQYDPQATKALLQEQRASEQKISVLLALLST
jgi:hypothetical protein